MPLSKLEAASRDRDICLASLTTLGGEFGVTSHAMFLRLKAAGLWNGQYSEWYRMANGEFVLQSIVGGEAVAWIWDDPRYLEHSWKTGESVVGQTSVSFVDAHKNRRSLSISFETQRRGNKIVALWANGIRKRRNSALLEGSPAASRCRLPPSETSGGSRVSPLT